MASIPATTSAASTASCFPNTHDKILDPIDTKNFIDNEFTSLNSTEWFEVHDPATNNIVTRVPQTTGDELRAAVMSAEKASPAWELQASLLDSRSYSNLYT